MITFGLQNKLTDDAFLMVMELKDQQRHRLCGHFSCQHCMDGFFLFLCTVTAESTKTYPPSCINRQISHLQNQINTNKA